VFIGRRRCVGLHDASHVLCHRLLRRTPKPCMERNSAPAWGFFRSPRPTFRGRRRAPHLSQVLQSTTNSCKTRCRIRAGTETAEAGASVCIEDGAQWPGNNSNRKSKAALPTEKRHARRYTRACSSTRWTRPTSRFRSPTCAATSSMSIPPFPASPATTPTRRPATTSRYFPTRPRRRRSTRRCGSTSRVASRGAGA
jgi:hypothetical protein